MTNNLRAIRKAKNVTLEDLAEMSGISTSYLSRIESGDRGLSLENLVKVARALDADPYEITDDYPPGMAEDAAEFIKPATKSSKAKGFYSLDIRAGMGGGGALSVLADGDGVPDLSDGVWTMPDRVAALFHNPGKTYVLPVAGDSNEPTIRGGSFVFVDTEQNFPRDPDFYACDAGDGLVIKRLELIPRSEMIWVRSDNEAYDDYELRREDVMVFGRVVAVFQWRG